MTRRQFIPVAGAAAALGGFASMSIQKPAPLPDGPAGTSAVSILRAKSYSEDLLSRMMEGVKQCGLDVRGKRVLLKPNLVEFAADTVVNTDAIFVAAAVELFHKLGAAEVKIGEGPGHRRDTLDLADDAKYRSTIPKLESIFTDLNRDDVAPVKNFLDAPEFYFAKTVLAADLIVSLAKMKTHHWAGATLSMKNFFGLVPGSVYGWPKNYLHNIDGGIPRSVADLGKRFSNSFAIVDGVVGMEGNGPIQGTPKASGVIVMGHDLVAVDATCARIMGIDPTKIEYLGLAAEYGHIHPGRIEQRGETIASVQSNFELIEGWKHIRLT